MSSFPIDKDIPLPSSARGQGAKYRWDEMQVRDSFFIPNAKLKSVRTLCAKRNRLGSAKFIAREWLQEERGKPPVNGVRVWRSK